MVALAPVEPVCWMPVPVCGLRSMTAESDTAGATASGSGPKEVDVRAVAESLFPSAAISMVQEVR